MPVASSVVDAALAVDRAMRAIGVRWFMFGAQAAILRGVRRFSADLDVTLDGERHPTRVLVDALASEGVVLRVRDAEEFVRATRVLPLRHEATGLPVDAVLSGPGLEEEFFARATIAHVGGVAIPVPCTEDLVVMKVIAGRPKDVEDAVALVAANELDLDAVRSRVRTLEVALDQGDLLPTLAEIERRAARARSRR